MSKFGRFLNTFAGLLSSFWVYSAYTLSKNRYIFDDGATAFFKTVFDFWPGFLLALVISGVGSTFIAWENRKFQRQNDRRAKMIYDGLRDGTQSKRYSLYLRPFEIDTALTIDSKYQERWVPGSPTKLVTIDQALIEREGKTHDIIGLRLNSNKFSITQGMGTIVLQDVDDWKADVSMLIKRAVRLIVVPHPSPSVIWEISQIRKHKKLEATYFVMATESVKTEEDFYTVFGFFPNQSIKDFPRVFQITRNGEVIDMIDWFRI